MEPAMIRLPSSTGRERRFGPVNNPPGAFPSRRSRGVQPRRGRSWCPCRLLAATALLVAGSGVAAARAADEPPRTPAREQDTEQAAGQATEQAATPAAVAKQRHDRFAAMMKGVRLVGSFTRDDDESATPRQEEYEIAGATKIGAGDGWLVMARIRYGSVDVTVPVPVEVKWAGETPVITLDDVTIPGLGTFSSRVLFDRNRYAGTWTHDKVGGHMFGRIVTTAPPAAPATSPR
jgi:hypothetical protein